MFIESVPNRASLPAELLREVIATYLRAQNAALPCTPSQRRSRRPPLTKASQSRSNPCLVEVRKPDDKIVESDQSHARIANEKLRSELDRERKMIGSCFQRSGIYIFVISFACVYYLVNAPILLGHFDLGWHLAAGDLIRDQGNIPFHDPWSFTAGDRRWYNVSWLWDVIASLLFQYTNFSGLMLFVIACGAIIVGYLTSICLSSGASTTAVCISVLFSCLLYPAFAAYPNIYLTASPNISTMLLCVIFYAECFKRRKRFLLPALMVLWVNLHGGFLLGLIIIGFFGGTALLRRDWVNFKIYSLAGMGCFIATFINPLGWHIYEGLATVLGHFSQAYITEWWPYYRNITLPGSIPGIIYILMFIAFEFGNGGPCPVESRLLSWFFLFLGLFQFRYMSFFFLFSAVPFALHLSRMLPKQPTNFRIEKSLLAAGAIVACALPLVYLQIEPALGLPPMLSEDEALYLKGTSKNTAGQTRANQIRFYSGKI
jgi:hypothetical protein